MKNLIAVLLVILFAVAVIGLLSQTAGGSGGFGASGTTAAVTSENTGTNTTDPTVPVDLGGGAIYHPKAVSMDRGVYGIYGTFDGNGANPTHLITMGASQDQTSSVTRVGFAFNELTVGDRYFVSLNLTAFDLYPVDLIYFRENPSMTSFKSFEPVAKTIQIEFVAQSETFEVMFLNIGSLLNADQLSALASVIKQSVSLTVYYEL